MKNKKVRVRFAPSPTGHLHIGSIRVAIFNWLFARHNNGSYLLRIEDTDLERSTKEYCDSILESLDWCGINHDEEPIIQTTQIEKHKKIVEKLVEDGKAYRCYCTPEEIAERQKEKDGYSDLFSMYDGHCSFLAKASVDKHYVVRFKVPRDENKIEFTDLIRGPISFDIKQFDDFIIARSDGAPMYNLVVVIDDAAMKITHVIRGEDHISNTPKQIMLYKACGLEIPEFAHLPLILGPSGDRLSKRDAATSVLDYRKQGILPEALFNYLVRLGWSHGDQEIFTKDEMVKYFSLDHVGKKGSIFDIVKLSWLNSVYLKKMDSNKIYNYIIDNIEPKFDEKLNKWNKQVVNNAIDIYKSRCKTLIELIKELVLLHDGITSYEKESIEKWINSETKQYLEKLIDFFQDKSFSLPIFKDSIKIFCKQDLSIKLVALAQPIRIALTGTSASPGVFDLLTIVGKDESIKRIKALLYFLKK